MKITNTKVTSIHTNALARVLNVSVKTKNVPSKNKYGVKEVFTIAGHEFATRKALAEHLIAVANNILEKDKIAQLLKITNSAGFACFSA